MLKYLLPIIFFFSTTIFSHGTCYKVIDSSKISLKASFDSGVPIANAKVWVFPPMVDSFTNISKTDSQGVFSFSPNIEGEWTLQIRDKFGHGLRVSLNIDNDLKISAKTEEQSYINNSSPLRKYLLTAGVVLLFLFIAYISKKQRKA